ncbi:hypothetical protein A7U60_g4068 [Sanghuangporus baumii]|uniref:FHA domain-containing protein n=1 Tax=Sanghuangporus baumii TaxID=108892 RepID=A0A9Q5HZC3_SANBA|nr:hypothetical protein A7U60_g4068 [Sanghuangporus baumii]
MTTVFVSSTWMESWPTLPLDYDPSLEAPGSDVDSESETQTRPTSQHHTCFRLVVKSSEVLARKRRVAVLDAYEEVQIGRDASSSEDIPRIRLKDMEVSKLHTTLFWDRESKVWAIVDMGSKHGTFVKSGFSNALPTIDKSTASSDDLDAAIPDSSFIRLSPERHASRPRALYHMDELLLGRTNFVIHIHLSGLPCDECCSEGDFDIPLFSDPSSLRGNTQKSVDIAEDKARAPRDARTAISHLKRSLLTRHMDTPLRTIAGPSQQYVDRSAKRRALHPYSRSSSPPPGLAVNRYLRSSPSGLCVPPTDTSRTPATPFAMSLDRNPAYGLSQSSTISAPPVPISDMNVGHRLLEKQGWVPGNTLGVPAARSSSSSDKEDVYENTERMALLEPIQISTNIGRRGLGMRSDLSSSR